MALELRCLPGLRVLKPGQVIKLEKGEKREVSEDMCETDNSRLLGTSVEFVGHKHFSIDLCKSFGASPVSTLPRRSCVQMITPLDEGEHNTA